jgi:hypothetical protein
MSYKEDILHILHWLHSKGKNIQAIALPSDTDFYRLKINNQDYGVWSAIGLLSVISQYKQRSNSILFFKARGLPVAI